MKKSESKLNKKEIIYLIIIAFLMFLLYAIKDGTENNIANHCKYVKEFYIKDDKFICLHWKE